MSPLYFTSGLRYVNDWSSHHAYSVQKNHKTIIIAISNNLLDNIFIVDRREWRFLITDVKNPIDRQSNPNEFTNAPIHIKKIKNWESY